MKVELPHVGESVTEAIIDRWLKKVGDRVEKYDPLAEVVTDKVNMEMPSPASGVLTQILVEAGSTVPMGTVVAEIAVDGEAEQPDEPEGAPAAPLDTTGTLLKDVAPVGPTGSGGPMVAPEPARKPSGARFSPAVRRLAAQHGVDLDEVTGTGIGGRVTRKDVEDFVASQGDAAEEPGAADEKRVALTPIRRMIADNMARSASEIPEAWSTVEADVTGLVRLREGTKDSFREREGVAITYLPFMLKAVAESLKTNPLVNSTWAGDAIILKRRVNLGVATATTEGLIVPVVHDADTKTVAELARSLDDLAGRARGGKLTVQDVEGGTFTVNNTGAIGSVIGKAIIFPKQAAILNTEAIVKRPVVVDDAIAIRSIMNLSLTFDHRILDGAEAGAFLADVKRRLEAIGPDIKV